MTEKEFHFILGNKVEKDNRIPPAGFIRAAYMADAAFIVPRDKLDNDYADGQNWDDTVYKLELEKKPKGPLAVIATLKYQTFNEAFIDFLKTEDTEPTEKYGGRARDIPTTGDFGKYEFWGDVIHDIWEENGYGQPVEMATATQIVEVLDDDDDNDDD